MREVTAEHANVCWECCWERVEPTPPRAPGKTRAFIEQAPQRLHLSRWLREHGQQFVDRSEMANDHNHQRFQKQAIRIAERMAPFSFLGLRGDRGPINQVNQCGKQEIFSQQRRCLQWWVDNALARREEGSERRKPLHVISSFLEGI